MPINWKTFTTGREKVHINTFGSIQFVIGLVEGEDERRNSIRRNDKRCGQEGARPDRRFRRTACPERCGSSLQAHALQNQGFIISGLMTFVAVPGHE